MNLNYLFSLVILSLMVSGCASSNGGAGADETREVAVRVTEGNAKNEAGDDDIVCTREHRVGSNFPRTICRTRAEREADRRNSERTMRSATGPAGAGGN